MPTPQNEREAISNIQKYLRQLSYHDERINPVPIDGVWESDTKRAVAQFQRQNNLPITGTVDRATWDRLKQEYDRSVAENSPPARLDIFPREPQDYALTLGDKSFLTNAVQYMLGELSRLYYLPNFTITGEYDDNTANAIAEFQKRNLIKQTGNVDRETWDALTIQHNILLDGDE